MPTTGLNEELAAMDAGEAAALQGGPQQTTPQNAAAGNGGPTTTPVNARPNDGEQISPTAVQALG